MPTILRLLLRFLHCFQSHLPLSHFWGIRHLLWHTVFYLIERLPQAFYFQTYLLDLFRYLSPFSSYEYLPRIHFSNNCSVTKRRGCAWIDQPSDSGSYRRHCCTCNPKPRKFHIYQGCEFQTVLLQAISHTGNSLNRQLYYTMTMSYLGSVVTRYAFSS